MLADDFVGLTTNTEDLQKFSILFFLISNTHV